MLWWKVGEARGMAQLPLQPSAGQAEGNMDCKLTRVINRIKMLLWVLGDGRGPSNLRREEKLGPGPVTGSPRPTEDGASYCKGGICSSHPYSMPWAALETKRWLDGLVDSMLLLPRPQIQEGRLGISLTPSPVLFALSLCLFQQASIYKMYHSWEVVSPAFSQK